MLIQQHLPKMPLEMTEFLEIVATCGNLTVGNVFVPIRLENDVQRVSIGLLGFGQLLALRPKEICEIDQRCRYSGIG